MPTTLADFFNEIEEKLGMYLNCYDVYFKFGDEPKYLMSSEKYLELVSEDNQHMLSNGCLLMEDKVVA
jgi:hypothetical protein